MMKTVAILCFNDLSKDARVKRQIVALRDKYEIITIGCKNSGFSGLKAEYPILPEEYSMSIVRKSQFIFSLVKGNFDNFYWTEEVKLSLQKLIDIKFDVIIANDLEAIPICLKLAKPNSAKVIADLHEYYPGQGGNNAWLHNKYKHFLCKSYLHKVDSRMTVNSRIVDLYMKNYGVLVEDVVTNASKYEEIEPSKIQNKICLVHHGAAIKGRKIESLIDVAHKCGKNYELHLYLVGNEKYQDFLKSYSKGKNTIIHQAVSSDKLIQELNQYDIGIYILKPKFLNNKNALPNKIFEFIQSRLAVVISPNPAMADMVRKYDIGLVADDFTIDNMVDKIKSLSKEEIFKIKNNCNNAALRETAESNYKLLCSIVEKEINKSSE